MVFKHDLTQVSVWIKVFIIIILKPDSGVNPKKGSCHEWLA